MSAGAEPRLVDAERFTAGLDALAPVAEAIFGRGQRVPGWFARKLAREGVEPGLSTLVCRGEVPVGYALLGRAPSRGPIARGAGLGLTEALRGRGWGRRLLTRTLERAAIGGCASVEFLAADERLTWYRRAGFEPVRAALTLAANGTSPDLDLAGAALDPRTALGPAPLWSWFPEAWQRSLAGRRLLVELDAGARVWLLREGRAWLAVRAELGPKADPLAALTELRARLDRSTPLLLYPCPAADAWVHELIAAGFTPLQRATLVRRPTSPAPSEAPTTSAGAIAGQ